MEYRLDVGLWNQVFAVPCALVDRHIKLAGKEQLQAILWILRHPESGFSPEELAQALGMPVDAALDCLDYWEDQGLLASSQGTLRPVPQPEPAVAPVRAAAPEPAPAAQEAEEHGPIEQKKALPPKKRLLRPDGEHLNARLQESEEIRNLMQEAEATLGKTLSPAMSALLLTVTDDYGLPVEVTVMLIHYAQEVGKTGTSYIDSVARDWAESGIFTLEAAEQKLQELSRRRLAWGKVASAAGLPKRSPSKKEEDAACRWVYEWGFSQEMLSAAYESCVDHTGKFSAAYMDKVLANWHGKGFRNPQDLEAAQREAQEKQAKSKSYDIDELEKMSFFDLPDELK